MIVEMLIACSVGATAPARTGDLAAAPPLIAQAEASTRDAGGTGGASSAASKTEGTPGTLDSKGDPGGIVSGSGDGLGGTSSPDMKRAREARDAKQGSAASGTRGAGTGSSNSDGKEREHGN